jgi:hypothetical protein
MWQNVYSLFEKMAVVSCCTRQLLKMAIEKLFSINLNLAFMTRNTTFAGERILKLLVLFSSTVLSEVYI